MKPSFPLFLVIGVLLLVVCAIQVVFLLNPKLTMPKPEIGPLGFDRMVETHPVTVRRHKEQAQLAQQKLGVAPITVKRPSDVYDPAVVSEAIEPPHMRERMDVPVESFNPLIGSAGRGVQFVVFTDIDCLDCRERLKAFFADIDMYKDASGVVLKFLPAEGEEFRGGLFMQMAWQGGVFQEFFKFVLAHEGEILPNDYVSYLEKSGLSLAAQRSMMSERMSLMIRDLQKDIHLAERINVRRPNGYFLNGYRLGTLSYPLEEVESYILKILSGRSF